MKYLTTLVLVAVAMVALVTGCAAKHKVDTAKLTKAFAAAPAELKAQLDTAVKAINEKKLGEALDVFEKMADKGGLSAEQKQALTDAIVEVGVLVEEQTSSDKESLQQKVMDLQNKLM